MVGWISFFFEHRYLEFGIFFKDKENHGFWLRTVLVKHVTFIKYKRKTTEIDKFLLYFRNVQLIERNWTVYMFDESPHIFFYYIFVFKCQKWTINNRNKNDQENLSFFLFFGVCPPNRTCEDFYPWYEHVWVSNIHSKPPGCLTISIYF